MLIVLVLACLALFTVESIRGYTEIKLTRCICFPPQMCNTHLVLAQMWVRLVYYMLAPIFFLIVIHLFFKFRQKNGPPNTLWGSLFLHQLMPILNRLLTDIIIIIALTGKTKHRCWFWFSLYFIWQIENHISTSKHLPTVSLYGIGNKGIRGSHLPFWSNMFISTTGRQI